MAPSSTPLGEYLAPEERLVAVFDGRLHENTTRRTVSVGVTDRRLLCLSEDGWFVTVGYGSLGTVQRRTWTSRTVRGNDYRLLLGGGSLLAVCGAVGVLALATTVFVPLLVLTAVGGFISAAYLHGNATEIQWIPAAGVTRPTLSSSTAGSSVVETEVTSPELLMAGSAFVGVSSLVWLLLVSSSVLPVVSTLVVFAGIGLLAYAYRHRNDFDGMEFVRRREAELRVSTDDGRTVRIRGDSCVELGRELSRMAYAENGSRDRGESARS